MFFFTSRHKTSAGFEILCPISPKTSNGWSNSIGVGMWLERCERSMTAAATKCDT